MNHVQQMMLKLAMQIIAAGELLIHKLSPKLRDSRGDVPGWVMITLVSMLRLLLRNRFDRSGITVVTVGGV